MIPRVDRIEAHSFLASQLDAGSIVVDLGLCRGRFAAAIAQRYGCRIVGAEPAAELFRELPQVDRLSPYRVALGGTDGTTTLYLNAQGDPTASPGLAEDASPSVEVPVMTLDSFLAGARLTHVDLLKVDIEGSEIPALMSASESTLRTISQISVEFHDFIDPTQASGVREVDERLKSAGFRRIRFSRDNTDVLYLNNAAHGLGRHAILPLVLWAKYRMGLGRILHRRTRMDRSDVRTGP